MSNLTPTNEETLATLLTTCPKNHYLELISKDNWIQVYLCSNIDGSEVRLHKASFLALNIHPEAWSVNPGTAAQWR